MSKWHAFIEDKPWLDERALWLYKRSPFENTRSYAVEIKMVSVPINEQRPETVVPFLSDDRVTTTDGGGDVNDFLQAIVDEAWRIGIRPNGLEDTKSEIAAIRYHLDDMRKIALHKTVGLGK